MKRVVITGVGSVTPIGNNIKTFYENMLLGQSGVDYVTLFDANEFSTKIAAEVKNFNPDDYIEKKDVRRMDRFCHFALAATNEALLQSGLNISENPEKTGVIIGCGIGGFGVTENQHSILLEKGNSRVSPLTIPMIIPNIAGAYVAIKYNAKGTNYCPVTACASGTDAIGQAFKLIQAGTLESAICGGTESAITPLSFAGFCSLRAMSRHNEEPKKASRPFDAKRDGFVMGEGSGILILESLESAQKRKANILAEIKGYYSNCDAFHITLPEASGESIKKCMIGAVKDSGLNFSDIDYINAHGTSTEANDKTESMAIREVFYNQKEPFVSALKSMTGHMLGASGAIEAISCILSLENNIIPPTINFETEDPNCNLNYVFNTFKETKLNNILSNSFGFGGHNSSIVISRFN
ncbi:MAG: beta-ketoacyl-ACP synthase II [Candidatus Sericytochromatia bacterium]